MFLVTVVARAIFCGASFMYWTSLVQHASASDAVFFLYKAACYSTGVLNPKPQTSRRKAHNPKPQTPNPKP